MKHAMSSRTALGGAAALLVVAVAGCDALSGPKFADVVSVKEAKETIRTPREVCEDVVVQKQAPVQDKNRIAGKVIGGVAGGVLGHQIGGGRGQDVATAVGAVGGAAVGANVGRGSTYTQNVQKCAVVPGSAQPSYWDVTYVFRGREYRAQLTFPPGPTITVNGRGEPRV